MNPSDAAWKKPFKEGPLLIRLSKAIESSLGRFALFLVVGWDDHVQKETMEALKKALTAKGVRVCELSWLSLPPEQPLLRALQERLDPSACDVLFVHGLEKELASFLSQKGGTVSLYQLNLAREELARRFSFPWVFWLTPLGLRALAEYAPDFYDLRLSVFWQEEPPFQERPFPKDNKYLLEIQAQETAPHGLSEEGLKEYTRLFDALDQHQRLSPQEQNLFLHLAYALAEHYRVNHQPEKAWLLLEKIRPFLAGPQEKARYRGRLGLVLRGLGRREEALAATKEAVEIYRKLAEKNPEAFLPDLATSLNNLGLILRELGRREEALAATKEAVEIRRKLAEKNPEAFLPNLAGSLNNLGAMLRELGRREEALAATKDAVEIRRKLAEKNPEAFLPDLARSLVLQGVILGALGQKEAGCASLQEALLILAPFFGRYPEAFGPLVSRIIEDLKHLDCLTENQQ